MQWLKSVPLTPAIPCCLLQHCGHCGFCISRMDHHCMWLDGCVGSHNHVRFLSFLTLHVLSCGLYAAFALFVLKGAVSAELAANALGSGACQVHYHQQTNKKGLHPEEAKCTALTGRYLPI
jgi:hypothetical protein